MIKVTLYPTSNKEWADEEVDNPISPFLQITIASSLLHASPLLHWSAERAIPYPNAARGLSEPGLDAMWSLIESIVT